MGGALYEELYREAQEKYGIAFIRGKVSEVGVNISNIKGVFYAGTCTAPMNITETISHARSAVAEVIDYFRNAEE